MAIIFVLHTEKCIPTDLSRLISALGLSDRRSLLFQVERLYIPYSGPFEYSVLVLDHPHRSTEIKSQDPDSPSLVTRRL